MGLLRRLLDPCHTVEGKVLAVFMAFVMAWTQVTIVPSAIAEDDVAPAANAVALDDAAGQTAADEGDAEADGGEVAPEDAVDPAVSSDDGVDMSEVVDPAATEGADGDSGAATDADDAVDPVDPAATEDEVDGSEGVETDPQPEIEGESPAIDADSASESGDPAETESAEQSSSDQPSADQPAAEPASDAAIDTAALSDAVPADDVVPETYYVKMGETLSLPGVKMRCAMKPALLLPGEMMPKELGPNRRAPLRRASR